MVFSGVVRGVVLGLVVGLGLGVSSVRAQGTVAPGSQEDPAVTALVRRLYGQLATGTLDKSLLAPQLAADLTPDFLAQMKAGLPQLGEPTRIRVESRVVVQGGVKYLYAATFPVGEFKIWVLVMNDGRVGGFVLA
jgi:hypothetical protein